MCLLQLLDSGDLLISDVNWSDMGGFKCVAESPLGRDTATTFLYPMLGGMYETFRNYLTKTFLTILY